MDQISHALGPEWLDFGRHRANFGEHRPNLAEADQLRSISGHALSTAAIICPSFVESGPKFGQPTHGYRPSTPRFLETPLAHDPAGAIPKEFREKAEQIGFVKYS